MWPPERSEPLSSRFLGLPAAAWSSVLHSHGSALTAVLRLEDRGLPLPFSILGPPFGECRPDPLPWVLVIAVHSLRPSDIKFVAAIGNVETVSILRGWRWETGIGIVI